VDKYGGVLRAGAHLVPVHLKQPAHFTKADLRRTAANPLDELFVTRQMLPA
jgi:hypothetical protein